jgi:hypothetical protein
MKVERKALIGGQPVKVVRDLLQRHGNITLKNIVEHLKRNWIHEFAEDLLRRDLIDRHGRNYLRKNFDPRDRIVYGIRVPKMPDFSPTAKTLFDYLLAEGYIIEAAVSTPDNRLPNDGKDRYQTTIKGQALRITTLAPRISRAKAEALLAGVLERVAQANADPELLDWVTEVRVFGSYLTDADDHGDLDIALSYRTRPTREGLQNFSDEISAFAERHGKQHLSWRDQLFLPERMLKQRIKGRSPHISMHNISELNRNPQFGGKTVYTFTPPQVQNK